VTLRADDLLNLRLDITDPAVVRERARNLEAKKTVTVIAETGEEMAGYAILHHHVVTR
jgi:hypothetical protein